MKEIYLNSPEDCQWLRETHLKDSNLNNGPVPEFKSFCLFGNEDCPTAILIYKNEHPTIDHKPIRFDLCGNGAYSSFDLQNPDY
jgi:hypothetical protein